MIRVVLVMFLLAVAAFAQAKVVTNADLEKFKTEREAADKRFRETYQQKGFKSPEEAARERQQKLGEYERYFEERRAADAAAQNDIIGEANDLRRRIAALDAQIAFVAQNSSRPAPTLSYGYYGYGTTYGGGYRQNNARQSYALRQISKLPPNMRAVQETAAMYPSSQGLFQQSINGVRVAPGSNSYHNRRGYFGGFGIAPVITLSAPVASSTDLNYLLQQRAGLIAEWRIVEEKARRAGIRLD